MTLLDRITSPDPAVRNLPFETWANGQPESALLAEAARLDTLRRESTNLYDRVRALVFLSTLHRFHLTVAASGRRITFIEQPEPRGYAHAISLARDFVANSPLLHLVGDHFYLADHGPVSSLTAELIRIHAAEGCSVSAVSPTREGLLPFFGAVGGPAIGPKLYQVDTVLEKPTPTEAERVLTAAGLRQGQYLCFFGIHLFTPALLQILAEQPGQSLSAALQTLSRRERYLATILPGRRFDIGAKYGLLQSQLALALGSSDREEILSLMLELTAR